MKRSRVMSSVIDKLLAKGLAAGFGGGPIRSGITRGGFGLKSSHLEKEGKIYHDEWLESSRAGGGQEIVRVGETSYTRVYAGGTIPQKELQRLGITGEDVMKVLKKQMLENGERIRLHTDFAPAAEGDWQYTYKVTSKNKQIPMTTGKEVISFKGKPVFEHDFIICPAD